MKVLTVRQPWASAIIWGGKDIENRMWKAPKTLQEGSRLGIHAAARCPKDEELVVFIRAHRPAWELLFRQQDCKNMLHGAIIGSVRFEHCELSLSGAGEWGEIGIYHWYLSDPQPCEPIYTKGKLGLWEIDDALIEEQKEQPHEADRQRA